MATDNIKEPICICTHFERFHYGEFCNQCARANDVPTNQFPLDPEHWYIELTPKLSVCLETYATERMKEVQDRYYGR